MAPRHHGATRTDSRRPAAPRIRTARDRSRPVPYHRYAEHGPAQPSDVLHGIALRLRWCRLVERHAHRFPLGVLALVNGVISIGLLATAAAFTHQPLVFPSLGPTAFLLFYRPHAEVSCPRNALAGHLIGAGCGLGSLAAFGLVHHGPALGHVTAARIGAAALSLGMTAAVMIWAGAPHPPAGATTLIISLGFLDTPEAVGILLGGVLLLVLQCFVVNRWAGIDYPVWAPHRPARAGPSSDRRAARERTASPMRFDIFVDVDGDTALDAATAERLQALLGTPLRELHCGQHEWTGVLSVEAADLDEAASMARASIELADADAGLVNWHCRCWEIREQLVPLDDDVSPWHPHLPHGRVRQLHVHRHRVS